jgi:ACS family tartrate transporter-like MFS transporter
MPAELNAVERAAVARAIRRLIPFLFACYVVAYIDRVNIGFAATELQRDLGLNNAVYGLGAGLFFLGYCLFEIPSNLVLERVGARRWMARIMIGWGIVSIGMMLVSGTRSFYTGRILLGVAEAGFFPGAVLYLTYWIPAAERARAGALFMAAAPIAVIVGAPVSEALLSLDGVAGLKGWQWLFLIEGLPALALGGAALAFLTDRPEQASWLPSEERRALGALMAEEQTGRSVHHAASLRGAMTGRVWLLSFIYFLNALVTYGVFLWLPKILQDVSGARGLTLSAMTAAPFVVALVGMIVIGRHSDRTGDRKWHVAGCAITAAVGLVLAAAFRDNAALVVLSFTLSQTGQRSVMSVFWAIPPQFLGGTAAAAGIALINSIGNLGGAVGPTVVGRLREASGGYTSGLLVLAMVLILQASLVAALRLPPRAAPARTGSTAG